MVRDPVCNMAVDEAQGQHALVYRERTYYFCSAGCRAEFQRHPEDYGEALDDETGGDGGV